MATRLEVKCINKTDRYNAYERIKAIGGGGSWNHTQEQAIKRIEDGSFAYYVGNGSHSVDVIVAMSQYCQKYLKTTADGEQPNNLLSLPECA